VTKITDYKLHIIKGDESYIPKYNITTDIKYFDLDSLIRLYGQDSVKEYIRSQEAV